MELCNKGQFIKDLRKKKGWSQQQLSEGICSHVTLSRLERGDLHEISYYHFSTLLEKLDANVDDQNIFFMGNVDYKIYEQRKKIEYLIYTRNYQTAKDLVEELEQDDYFKNDLQLQYLLSCKMSIELSTHKKELSQHKFNEIIEVFIQAIKLSKRQFKIDDPIYSPLSHEEMRIINQMAIAHHAVGDTKQAIIITNNLVQSSNKNCENHIEKIQIHIKALYNLSKYLGLQGKIEESLENCEKGIEICRKSRQLDTLPYLLYNKAFAIKELGNVSDSKPYLLQSYYSFLAKGDDEVAEQVKLEAKKEFGYEL